MQSKERRIIKNSYAPMFARYWQTEKAIRLRVGEFRPTHKLTIENVKYHTSEEGIYMEVSFIAAGRLPSGGDWTGCMRYFYSYVDWLAYNKPSFGVNSEGDICNFLGLLVQHQMNAPGEPSIIKFRLDELNESDADDKDEDDEDDGEGWKDSGDEDDEDDEDGPGWDSFDSSWEW